MAKLLLFLASLTVLGTAHSVELSDLVTIIPAIPASGEPFVVVFSGFDSICEEQSPTWSVVGQRLILDLRAEFLCGPSIEPFPIPTDFRFEISGLQPGSYEIEFYSNAETQTFPPASGVVVTVAAPVSTMNNAGIFWLMIIIGLMGLHRDQCSRVARASTNDHCPTPKAN